MQFNRDAAIEIIDRSGYSSRADFARAVGISPGSLHDILGGVTPRRRPSDELIRNIAAELKVPVTAIIHAPAEQEPAA